MKKVFITGATGFLGAYIVQELVKNGYSVRALRRSSKLPGFVDASIWQHLEWIDGDILDVVALQEGMAGVDVVIHSAAIVSFHKRDRDQMFLVNQEGTANVVNMALEAGIKKLIHVSSVAALGRTSDGQRVDEEKKWSETRNNTNYARSKYKAELEVWRGIAEGLPAVIVNPSTILGYGDWNNGSSAIFRNVYNEFPWYSPGLNGFVDVRDVALACRLLLESDIEGERFIVNGDNWPFKRLLHTIAEEFGKKKARKETTLPLLAFAWRWERFKSWFSGNRPLLTPESARVAHSRTVFDNQKLLKFLPGFSYTPLEKTIAEACAAYKKDR